VKLHPPTAKCAPPCFYDPARHDSSLTPYETLHRLADRERTTEVRNATALYDLTTTARSIMVDELTQRFFAERPSNSRLVQIWMSKQYPAEKWLPEEWKMLAKGLYLNWLREAAKIAGIALRSSPPRKVQKKEAGGSALVRNVSDSEEEEEAANTESPLDTVTEEVERWSKLDKAIVKKFRDAR
jgi:hypothetical protein